MFSEINNQLQELKSKINLRKSLLADYQSIARQLDVIDKKKENYSQVLALTNQQDKLQKALIANQQLVQTYNALIDKKEILLQSSSHPILNELNPLNQSIKEKKQESSKLGETITAGTLLLNEVTRLIRSLGHAKSWGIGDLFFGGSVFSRQPKHKHLQDAQGLIKKIEQLSTLYYNELNYLQLNTSIKLNINASFTDLFFSDGFTEWFVQFKIHLHKKQAQIFEQRIKEQIEVLENKEADLDEKIEILEIKKIKIIETI